MKEISIEELSEEERQLIKKFFGGKIRRITSFPVEPAQKKTLEVLDENKLRLIQKHDEIEFKRNKNNLDLELDEKERRWKLKKRQTLFYLSCSLLVIIFVLSVIAVAYYPEGSSINKTAQDAIKIIISGTIGGLLGYSYAKRGM